MKNDLKSLLTDFYHKENVTQLEPADIFRCERKDDLGRVYQIVYFDTSAKWLEPDVKNYIEVSIQDNFYQNDNFLQCNYYYYFITDASTLDLNIKIANQLSADTDYCRKDIFTTAGLVSRFSALKTIAKPSHDVIKQDLYSTWVNYLRKTGMAFVYNDIDYPNFNPHVENYLNNEIPAIEKDLIDNTPTKKPEVKWKKLTSLKFESSRKFPINRHFDLGTINLIHGPNAVGKTSFLDFLEMAFTGGGESVKREIPNKVEVEDVDGHKYIYPDKSLTYKERDTLWYNSGLNRGNNLANNFKKFNYFKSDAAFDLKVEETTKKNDFYRILSTIALGSEVNRLEERITGFKTRFEEKVGEFSKSKLNLLEQLNEKTVEVSSATNLTIDSNGPRNHLRRLLLQYSWNIPEVSDNDDFLALFNYSLRRVRESLIKINSFREQGFNVGLRQVQAELSNLASLQVKVDIDKNSLAAAQEKKHQSTLEVIAINRQKKIFEELATYFNHPNFRYLLGLERTILSLNTKVQKCREISELSKAFFLTPYLEQNIDEDILISQLFVQTTILNKDVEIKKKQKQVAELQMGLASLTQLVNQIKSFGIEYERLMPKTDNCPLCNTKFAQGKLIEAINNSRDSINRSELVDELSAEIFLLQEDQTSMEVTLKNLTIAKNLQQLFAPDKSIFKLRELISTLHENDTELLEHTSALSNYRAIMASFELQNLSEEKFMIARNRLQQEVKILMDLPEDFTKQYLDFQLKNINTSTQSVIYEIEVNNLDAIYKANFTSELLDEREIGKRLLDLKELEALINELFEYLNFDHLQDIVGLNQQVSEISSAFDSLTFALREEKNVTNKVEILNVEIRDIIQEIETKIEPKLIKSQFAVTTLGDLVLHFGRNTFLIEYLQSNRKELVTIFKLIHSPKEFTDIKFQEDQIVLISNDGQKTIEEISTGQRSALALSLFLTLNKKLQHGPDIILLDDPITHVDDLNVLSFLDYLRELSISSKKQIFFATASDDLAFLFRKKFEFIGETELVEMKLTREVDPVLQ